MPIVLQLLTLVMKKKNRIANDPWYDLLWGMVGASERFGVDADPGGDLSYCDCAEYGVR
jgi:hypothetical protein